MKITKVEYFLYEWLIIEKKLTGEQLEALTQEEWDRLLTEYNEFNTEE